MVTFSEFSGLFLGVQDYLRGSNRKMEFGRGKKNPNSTNNYNVFQSPFTVCASSEENRVAYGDVFEAKDESADFNVGE